MCDSLFDESEQGGTRGVGDRGQPDATDPIADLFGGHGHQRFRVGLTPSHIFFISTYIGLVHFDRAMQSITGRANHGPPELVKKCPGSLVALQAELPLNTEGAEAILRVGNPPHGPEPNRKWKTGSVEDRPRRNRRRVTAPGALHQGPRLTRPGSG